jgi:hypothetical protein
MRKDFVKKKKRVAPRIVPNMEKRDKDKASTVI